MVRECEPHGPSGERTSRDREGLTSSALDEAFRRHAGGAHEDVDHADAAEHVLLFA